MYSLVSKLTINDKDIGCINSITFLKVDQRQLLPSAGDHRLKVLLDLEDPATALPSSPPSPIRLAFLQTFLPNRKEPELLPTHQKPTKSSRGITETI